MAWHMLLKVLEHLESLILQLWSKVKDDEVHNLDDASFRLDALELALLEKTDVYAAVDDVEKLQWIDLDISCYISVIWLGVILHIDNELLCHWQD